MTSRKVIKCIRNDSKSLPYAVNKEYAAEYVGGAYKIFDHAGGHIIAPLDGSLVEFIKIG